MYLTNVSKCVKFIAALRVEEGDLSAFTIKAAVAQSAERVLGKDEAMGSSPVSSTST